MGGKNKQSQRTKNNARPSSSGRSAELLNNSLRPEGSTVLTGGKTLPALFPSLAAATLDSTIPPEYALCFKKLNKKDPITRVKALQELTELVGSSKAEAAAAALAGWAPAYRALAADPDRKVREHAQVCQGAVAAACGRRLAPWLRALLPAWLQSQHDEHAPAMCAARRSLQSTFPGGRLAEAVSFCRAEVAAHALAALLTPAPTPAHARVESPEEREQLQMSAQRGALHTLRALAATLPAEHAAWLAATLRPLLAGAAFWQLPAAHPDPSLRAAWYAAVGQVWARAGEHIEAATSQRALRRLLACREPAAPAAPHYWAALLHLAHCSPDWYEWLDKKELLVKRIVDLLENGGWGEARSLGDALLPLLARLPATLRAPAFYTVFFRAARQGLMTKSVISSKSERQWWITSMAECLRYLSIQGEEFVVEVTTAEHRNWLEAVTTHPDPQIRTHIVRHSATNMTSLVKYWLKLSKKENGEKYDQLVRNFWQNVGSTILTQIDAASTEMDEVAALIEGHTVLLHTLKVSFLQELKKQQSIKFEGDAKVEESEVTEQKDQKSDTVDTERYIHNLDDVVRKACGGYFEFASRKKAIAAVFGPLGALLKEFDSEALWASIAGQLGAPSPLALYQQVLAPWLRGTETSCESLVHAVFLLMKHLTEAEEDAVFESFKELEPAALQWCLGAALAHPTRARPAARRWLLRSATAQAAVMSAASAALAGSPTAAPRRLLLMCLAQDEHGELTVSEECLAQVVELVSNRAWEDAEKAEAASGEAGEEGHRQREGEGEGEASTRVALAAALSAALPARASPKLHVQLAESMFRLNLHVHRGSSLLPADGWDEARGCWQELSPAAASIFRPDAVQRIKQRLTQQSQTLDINEIEHIASLSPYLIPQSDAAQPDPTEVVQLTQQLLDTIQASAEVEVFALRHDCLTSALNCPFDDDNDRIKKLVQDSDKVDAEDLTKEALLSHLNRFLFRAIYLRTILLRKPGEDDEESEEMAKCWCETLFKNEYIVQEFAEVLYDYCVLCSLHEGYAYWPHYSIIQQAKQKLDVLLDDILVETSAEARGTIMASLSEKAAIIGYYWAFARRWYQGKIAGQGAEEVTEGKGEGETSLEDIVTGNGFFHTMQAANKNSSDPNTTLRTHYLTLVRSLQAAYGAQPDVIDDKFLFEAAARDCDAGVLVDLHYRHPQTVLLLDREITSAPWAEAVCTAAAAHYLASLVEARGWDAPSHHWDFITLTLCSLLDSLDKSKEAWGSTKVAMVAHAVFALHRAVERFIGSVRKECSRRQPSPHVAALPREWADVFAPHAAGRLARCALHVLESSTSSTITAAHICYMSSLAGVAAALRWSADVGGVSLERVTRACCTALADAPSHASHYFAYKLLLNLAEALVLDDAAKLSAWEALAAAAADEERAARGRPLLALAVFRPALRRLAASVAALLQPYRVGEDTCTLEPHTAEYNTTLGYLLLSDAFHVALCTRQRHDLALHYIEQLREDPMAEHLLTASMRLLPPALAALPADASVPQYYLDMFVNVKELDFYEAPQSDDICALACRGAYGACAGAARGGARAWWGAAGPRAARAAHALARRCVAPPLVRAQLQHLHERRDRLQHAQISIAWSAREATCCYRVEDTALQVAVAFDAAHPLRPPRVHAPAPAAAARTAHWLQLYLAYQNGSLVTAFQMWMRCVSARLERAPQCYICYCRLHPTSGRLPAAPCHQCGNKFHTQCLRKWFSTSNKSNCPLCRGTF